tara:strand:- start:3864 stop:4145 length:282 start_codon:yes stop_codon:yes gene_type:complete
VLVKLISLYQGINGGYVLKEIMINPKHIVMISDEPSFKKRLEEGKLNLGLVPEVEFTRITMADSPYQKEIVVVGSPHDIESKIFQKSKQLLRG